MNAHAETVQRSRRRVVVGLVLGLLMLGVPGVVLATIPGRGFLEICKTAAGPGVTGTFQFTVAGVTVPVPVGACSPPIEVPAGAVTVTEEFRPGLVVAGISASPAARLISRDLAARSATVAVVEGDASTQTVVTFANTMEWGQLKVCKVAGPGVAVGTNFVFLAGDQAVNVPAGPAPGGFCALAGSFLVGTGVTVAESVPSGMQVTDIAVSPSNRATGAPNLAAGRVAVAIGTGVTEVVFTNAAAPIPTTTTTTTVPTGPTTTTTLPGGGILPATTTTLPGGGLPTTTTLPGGGLPTTTTVPGGGLPTTTTLPGGGLPTTTTLPGGGLPTTTTVPGGGLPTTTTLPGGGILPATTTTLPGGGPTTTTLPGGGPTTTTLPGGPTTTTTLPGGLPPTTLGPPGAIPPPPGGPGGGARTTSVLAITGSTALGLLPWAALAALAGLVLVQLARREPGMATSAGPASIVLTHSRPQRRPRPHRQEEPAPTTPGAETADSPGAPYGWIDFDDLDLVLADLPPDLPDLPAVPGVPDGAPGGRDGGLPGALFQRPRVPAGRAVAAVSPRRWPATAGRPARRRPALLSAPLDLGP